MKRFLLLIVSLSLFNSCQTEQGAGPANEPTFIRFIGTPDNNHAVLAVESTDGYTLLSNTELEGNGHRISLIKTDVFGHLRWQRVYPDNGANYTATSMLDMTAAGSVNPGYLIIGDSIKGSGTDLLLLKTDPEGVVEDLTTISFSDAGVTYPLHGNAVTIDHQGDYLVLGSIDNHPQFDMYVAKLDPVDMSVIWSRSYGAGESITVNRLFQDNQNNLWWGGSVLNTISQKYAVRLIRAPEDSESSSNSAPLGDPLIDETARDFCKITGGWAITGSSDEKGDQDIFILRVDNEANIVFSVLLENPAGPDYGMSIARTEGNGLVVLGTATTTEKRTDLTLARITSTGTVLWQYNYGGSDRQEAASVRVTSDGSYLVFGTTYFASEAKLMLMKLNRDGKLY